MLGISITQCQSQMWISKFLRASLRIVLASNQTWPWQVFLRLRTSHGCKMQPWCDHFQFHLKHNCDAFILTGFPQGGKHQQQPSAPVERQLGKSWGSSKRECVGSWAQPGTEPSPAASACPLGPQQALARAKILHVAMLKHRAQTLW